MRVLVTGGLGFIGSAVVRLLIDETEHQVLNVDKVTYAANPASVKEAASNPRYRFAKADIADGAAMRALFADFAPDAVVHLAAESHVDRSIDGPRRIHHNQHRRHVRAARGGHGLLARARPRRRGAFSACCTSRRTRCSARSPRRCAVQRAHCLLTALARTPRARPRPTISCALGTRRTHCRRSSPMLEQLRAVSLPEKLIPLTILKAMRGEELPVYGKGENVRDWLFVEDHARALLLRARAREARTDLYRGRQRGNAKPRGRATDLRPAGRHARPATRRAAASTHSLRRGSPRA
jgi:dTDP-glucose 4,6-dehydratase